MKEIEELITIQGKIRRVIFSNPSNGWSVLSFQTQEKTMRVVGNFFEVNQGETLKLKGSFSNHSNYGEQFDVKEILPVLSGSIGEIRNFLSSGIIKGIGPSLSERLIDQFGDKTFDILDENPKKLLSVSGIGKKKFKQITDSWNEQSKNKKVIFFLQKNGIFGATAVKIYNHYEEQTISILQNNPYQIALDIPGIGFKIADRIALKLGIGHDSEERAAAIILFLLQNASERGHVFLPQEYIINQCLHDFELPQKQISLALEILTQTQKICLDDIESDTSIYLRYLYQAERDIAISLQWFSKDDKNKIDKHFSEKLESMEKELILKFSPLQQSAIEKILTQKAVIITGGPGTGKTTLLRCASELLRREDLKVSLCAPTGRAARRLAEATGMEAFTIHRLLGWGEDGPHSFFHNASNLLETDAVIIDEVSMVDVWLFASILRAIPPHARLVLIGDADQLPSVGPGSVLQHLIHCEALEVIRLREIYRQQAFSRITSNAHLVNQGEMPEMELKKEEKEKSDFFLFPCGTTGEAVKIIKDLVTEKIPEKFGFDPKSEIQVLSPMRKGEAGCNELNRLFQNALNPFGQAVTETGFQQFRVGDKVMQTKNNYTKEVFNGEMGFIRDMERKTGAIEVKFDAGNIVYQSSDLKELELAYAITIHKSQGSEYPAIVVPVLTRHYIMLQRKLLYTAISRGKRLVILVGSRKAIKIAIDNNNPDKRFSSLSKRIQCLLS